MFAGEEHVAVEGTWCAYQQIIAVYASTDRRRGQTARATVIDRLRAGLDEPATLEMTSVRADGLDPGPLGWRRQAAEPQLLPIAPVWHGPDRAVHGRPPFPRATLGVSDRLHR